MKKIIALMLFAFISYAITYAQDGEIHSLLIEPVVNEDMVFSTDSIAVEFSYFLERLRVNVENKTDKRLYIEWENARYDGSRIVFGDDSRLSMRNPKSDEAVAAKSRSVSRSLLAESWVMSDKINNPLSEKEVKGEGGYESNIILPIRFGESEPIDYKFTVAVYFYNPVDCSGITTGMKMADVKKIAGNPDKIMLKNPMWGTSKDSYWYYASNVRVEITKGVVTEITNLKKNYIK